jgi:hypothetical protein
MKQTATKGEYQFGVPLKKCEIKAQPKSFKGLLSSIYHRKVSTKGRRQSEFRRNVPKQLLQKLYRKKGPKDRNRKFKNLKLKSSNQFQQTVS